MTAGENRGNAFAVRNGTRDIALADRAGKASNPFTRGRGLIGRKDLAAGEALIIQPCNSIVMFFMRFPLDVVFVDANGRVCHLVKNIQPWRTSKIVRQSKFVVELPAGTIDATGTELDDEIVIETA